MDALSRVLAKLEKGAAADQSTQGGKGAQRRPRSVSPGAGRYVGVGPMLSTNVHSNRCCMVNLGHMRAAWWAWHVHMRVAGSLHAAFLLTAYLSV